MERIVFYARSATSKLEVDRQFQMMEESLAPGVEVVGSYFDVGSGMDSNRPGLRQALASLQKGEAEALLIRSIDRPSRSVRELARLASMFRIESQHKPGESG